MSPVQRLRDARGRRPDLGKPTRPRLTCIPSGTPFVLELSHSFVRSQPPVRDDRNRGNTPRRPGGPACQGRSRHSGSDSSRGNSTPGLRTGGDLRQRYRIPSSAVAQERHGKNRSRTHVGYDSEYVTGVGRRSNVLRSVDSQNLPCSTYNPHCKSDNPNSELNT